jgi:hypothetical protein
MDALVAQVGVAVEEGVKLYVVFPTAAVEIAAGDQVPAIPPLLEVDGKDGGVPFRQKGPS